MTPPARIYRYQPSSSYAIRNLSETKLWFSDPSTFNDPFDCATSTLEHCIQAAIDAVDAPTALQLFISTSRHRPELLTEMASKSEAELQRIARGAFRHAIKLASERERGICCFSEKKDDLLMWGHYAESHRGFCLEFDTTFDPFNSEDKFHPVRYQESLPSWDLNRLAEGDFEQLIYHFCTKAICWSYEHEWRTMHKKRNTAYEYEQQALTAVYFGARASVELKQSILAMPSLAGTKFFEMQMSSSSFHLIAKPL